MRGLLALVRRLNDKGAERAWRAGASSICSRSSSGLAPATGYLAFAISPACMTARMILS